MSSSSLTARETRLRNLLFFGTPPLWPQWPFLPVVRRRLGVEEEHGVLYDAKGVSGTLGYSATIFLTNYFLRPSTEAGLLALPREVHDCPEELWDAGWTID
jgi:hypothetical protein